MNYPIDASRRTAAKVVGLAYLFVLLPALFAEFYVPGQLIDYDNAAVTARNIMAHERLFRLGIAANLVVFIADVVLITALYAVLEPINRNLALLATFFRLLETAVLLIVTLDDLAVLRILSGAAYTQAFDAGQLQAMARLAIAAHADAYRVGLLLFGMGSPLFCVLWLRSRYIPRQLAAYGVVASAWVGVCAMAVIVFPELSKVLSVAWYGGPMFLFELAIGFWLVTKGIRPPANAGPRTPDSDHLRPIPLKNV